MSAESAGTNDITSNAQRHVQQFLASDRPRWNVVHVEQRAGEEAFRRDVLEGLDTPDQKSIPPTYFYDERGSKLYEKITQLQAYYPARTEMKILRRYHEQISQQLTPGHLLELGSGSAKKSEPLVKAWHQELDDFVFIPIDVNEHMIESSAKRLCQSMPHLRVLGLVGRYEPAIQAVPQDNRELVMFLGGTIGNFEHERMEEFFGFLSESLNPGSHVLLGFDRASHEGKPSSRIQRAYDDPQGVTAAFNKNLMVRLNRELGADFQLDRWTHRAIYNSASNQIELFLHSDVEQRVRFEALGRTFSFREGETILTELSRKFVPEQFSAWCEKRGFVRRDWWTDDREYFAVMLLQRQ